MQEIQRGNNYNTMLISSLGLATSQMAPSLTKIVAGRSACKVFLSTSQRVLNVNKHVKSDSEILNDIKDIPLKDIKVNTKAKEDVPNFDPTSKFTNWKTIGLFTIASAGIYYWAYNKKKELEIIKEVEANRSTVGGPFKLVDFNGNEFTEQNLLGKFSLLYFGFSHCPDICPAELDKLSQWIDGVKKDLNVDVQPVFITCDPIRDSPKVLKKYLKDFHPSIIGLTGTHCQIKDMCKNYKVFFSTPADADPKADYIVDHSTFTYVIDPEGQFIEAIGTIYDDNEGLQRIEQHIKTFLPKTEMEKRLNKWYAFLFK